MFTPDPTEQPRTHAGWGDRIVLDDVELRISPNGSARVTVRLTPPGRAPTSGVGTGLGHREGRMRAAAEAALDALAPLCANRLRLDLRGIRVFRAFDTHLVVVALTARADDAEYRLIGSVGVQDEDLARGTVMALLDAANRVLDRYVVG